MRTYLLTAVTAFFLSLVATAALIPILRKIKAGQNILVYVKEHKNKSGTPTMGGLAFTLATLVACAIFLRGTNKTTVITLVVALAYMCVGLLDDFLKLRHKENLGLHAWQKFAFQFLIAVFVGIYALNAKLTVLNIPFLAKSYDVGVWILPIFVFVFLGTVNAVNLTDGLDGLASAVSVPFFAVIGVLILLQGGSSELATVCFALVGALCAYLVFNSPPASVFMGDTGSLALGGFAACVGVFSGNALYIATLGIAFVLSVISVILQVIYYKATHGKRIFLMAPLHHHFQEKGFSESKISYAYFALTLLLGIAHIIFEI